jgi:hypothetical protein
MSLLEALLTQTHEHAHDARAIIKDALGIVDHVKGASSKIRTDRDLSDAGRQKKVVDLVLSHPWAHLVQLRGKPMPCEPISRRRAPAWCRRGPISMQTT